MMLCLNARCGEPNNPDYHRFCQSCGWRLQLGDRYEAIYPLGAGHNSQTLVGRDRAMLVGTQCLIKRFLPNGDTVLAKLDSAERFRREVAQLAIASRHPQIPDLMAYFERDEQQFLVQQFLAGPHLDQRLQEKLGPFDSDEVQAFLRDVLPILHHLHQNRLIHRDIKPSNFRQPSGQSHWWLVDFGAIKPVTATQMARPGTLIGSADYASPEQLRGEATYASDIYSLGVVCLHLLTGLQPFDLFDSVNGCWQWRSIAPEVAPGLAALIDQMVQPALRDRPPDVATVMTHLGLPLPTAPDPISLNSHPTHEWQPVAPSVNLNRRYNDMAVLATVPQLVLLTTAATVEVRSLSSPTSPGLSLSPAPTNITAIAVHPREPIWVSGDRQGQLQVWRLTANTWQGSELGHHHAEISCCQFTVDGNELLVADTAGQLHLWDWPQQTRQQTWHEHAAKVTSLALSPDGATLASGDSLGSIKVWDWPNRTCLRTFSRQPGAITAIAWLAGSEVLVTAGWDVSLRWRCPHTGGTWQAANAQGFYLPVRSLLPHPTASAIIAGSQDGQLQLWASQHPSGHSSYSSAISRAATLSDAVVALRPGSASVGQQGEWLCLTATGKLSRWSTLEP